jgi:hypothetical protein
MPHRTFFSWQSDTPNECGRSFVEGALIKALKLIGSDTVVDPAIREEGLAVDSDTRDVAGSPPIVDTIFKKIDRAAIFLADLTFVATRLDGKRKSPNPNVLVEHGWALKSLGYYQILGVMNTAYGEPSDENMPFDMKHLKRPIPYHLPAGSTPEVKQKAREQLTKDLKRAIETVFTDEEFLAALPKPPPVPKFVELQPKEGLARFRPAGVELGLIDRGLRPSPGTAVMLGEGPAMWFRLMPDINPGRQWTVSDLRKQATHSGRMLLPLGWSAFSGQNYIRAQDGFGFTSLWDKETVTPAVAFAFTTGEVWTINVYPLSAAPEIPYVEQWYVQSLVMYVNFLKDGLGIAPPYRWIAGLEQVKGRRLQLGQAPPGRVNIFPSTGQCVSDDIVAEGIVHSESDIHLALKPFFDLIHDRCGIERSPHLDEVLKQAVSVIR